jgi:hypothetical protein
MWKNEETAAKNCNLMTHSKHEIMMFITGSVDGKKLSILQQCIAFGSLFIHILSLLFHNLLRNNIFYKNFASIRSINFSIP